MADLKPSLRPKPNTAAELKILEPIRQEDRDILNYGLMGKPTQEQKLSRLRAKLKKLAFIQPLVQAGAQTYRLNSKRKNLQESGRAAKEILKATRPTQHNASLKQQIYGHWV
jgi:hypothetical protein